ncbi:hypothetical protein VTO73DRAFT_11190 [Trametes versicolor]
MQPNLWILLTGAGWVPMQRTSHDVLLHNRPVVLIIVRRSIRVLTDTRTVPKTSRHHYIQPILPSAHPRI